MVLRETGVKLPMTTPMNMHIKDGRPGVNAVSYRPTSAKVQLRGQISG